MEKLIIALLFTFTSCFSQSYIEGYIFDKTTDESVPYATIKLVGSNINYTITNEDGKFEIKSKLSTDSLEIRHIGFQTKKVPISYFENNSKLQLSPNINVLNEVIIVANIDKNYVYNLLNKLIQKYRNISSIIESKAFLSLTSSARGIPIESIEGFYNNKQSLSKGIIDLKIKSGRFAQNKSFPFYSLDNTIILRDFTFFKKGSQILPLFPGNMSLNSIKNKYIVKFDNCQSCIDEDILISFIPKKNNGRLFSGKILFNKKMLVIKKIELEINNPITNKLTSINNEVKITPKKINLNIAFNPLDLDKIQYLDFTFSMFYKSTISSEIINSHTFLYFYDYNNPFEESYFTNPIHFNNDYDKIIASQASDDFWNVNIKFPKSYKEIRALDFFKEYGFLINYENSIPAKNIKYTNPSVILWSKGNRLKWKNIKQELTSFKTVKNNLNRSMGTLIKADKVLQSTPEMEKNNRSFASNDEFNFSYLLDGYKNENGKQQFVTQVLFDRNSSYSRYNRTKNKLVYLNLVFDIYEYYRESLNTQITDKMTFDEVKVICEEKFKEASLTVKKIKKETNFGKNYQNLIKWNDKVKSKLGIDNFKLIN